MKKLKELHDKIEKDVEEWKVNSCKATKQMQTITDKIYNLIKNKK